MTRARKSRGFVLALLLVVLAGLGVVGGIVAARFSARRQAQRLELQRAQALWVARSAVEQKRTLQQPLELEGTRATLLVRGSAGAWEAVVDVPGRGSARVVSGPGAQWEEHWTAAR